VVLNRVRHYAYPATVCGVVQQGSHLATGCQFSFTCDGSLRRRPEPVAWAAARRIAAAALNGSVYSPVGLATHYHTTAVQPYWRSGLRRLGLVGTHIFYSYSGSAGSSAAFVRSTSALERLSVAPRREAGEANLPERRLAAAALPELPTASLELDSESGLSPAVPGFVSLDSSDGPALTAE
jgi:hypothetical protein